MKKKKTTNTELFISGYGNLILAWQMDSVYLFALFAFLSAISFLMYILR